MTTTKLRITASRSRRHEVEWTTIGSPIASRTIRLTTSTGCSVAPISSIQGALPHGPVSSIRPSCSQTTKTSAWTGPSTSTGMGRSLMARWYAARETRAVGHIAAKVSATSIDAPPCRTGHPLASATAWSSESALMTE